MKIKTLKKICLTSLLISVLIPALSFADSSDSTASQVLTSNSYVLDVPSGFSFGTVFVDADSTGQAQKILDPENTETDVVKFTDLRGSSGGAFSVYAYMSDLTAEGVLDTISADNVGIASTHSNGDGYSVDYDSNNFLSPDQETVTGPIDYSGAITDNTMPENSYSIFTNSRTGILIMDGTLGRAELGRTGAYAVAPALLINIPANVYGSFSGTVTFELVLS